ncbi:MAG TPA: hypothetical protein DCS21_03590 [Gammaproteobacteria bacterium]|nr:hypothetical protein [Gammaproteobacteria bacterium]
MTIFADLIESEPRGVNWHTPEETYRLINMMSEINRAKVSMAQATGQLMVGSVYSIQPNGAIWNWAAMRR